MPRGHTANWPVQHADRDGREGEKGKPISPSRLCVQSIIFPYQIIVQVIAVFVFSRSSFLPASEPSFCSSLSLSSRRSSFHAPNLGGGRLPSLSPISGGPIVHGGELVLVPAHLPPGGTPWASGGTSEPFPLSTEALSHPESKC